MLHPILILSVLFISRCSCEAYTASPMTSHRIQHRWSSPSHLLSSTASVDGTSTATDKSTTTTDQDEDNIKTRDLLSLDYIRSTLIRQEETIIFALIERAQFRQNDIVYKAGGVPGLGVPPGSGNEEEKEKLSFLDFMFVGTVRPFDCIFFLACTIMCHFMHNSHVYLILRTDFVTTQYNRKHSTA